MTCKNKTDDLINNLCEKLEPQTPRCAYRAIALWILGSVIYVGGITAYLGLRHDIGTQMQSSIYLFEMGLALLILLSSSIASSWLSFPDCYGRPWIKTIAIISAAIFFLWTFLRSIEDGINFQISLHLGHCAGEGMYMEILPLLALVLITMRGRTTQPYWTMAMNVLAVSMLGWICLRLTCSMDDMGHSLFNHLLPFAIVATVLGFLARRLFKW